jgi:hypothetical protein
MGNPTVTPLPESFHNAGFIVSEAPNWYSREQVALASGNKLGAGTVLGQILSGLTAAAVAVGTNTGNGTFGAITPQAAPGTQIGVYSLLMTAATTFVVTAPDGDTANGTTGVAFSALGIGFTLTAGGTPFVANEGFTLTTAAAVGKPTITTAANVGNTGNGTMGSTSTVGYAATPGVYTVNFDAATLYNVSDPTGQVIGHGTTGVAFSAGGLSFTITAGGSAFAAGDAFAITVSAGSNKYGQWNPSATDGTQIVAGVLIAAKDATSADKPAAALLRQARVNASELVWPTGANAATITAGLAGLKKIGILNS